MTVFLPTAYAEQATRIAPPGSRRGKSAAPGRSVDGRRRLRWSGGPPGIVWADGPRDRRWRIGAVAAGPRPGTFPDRATRRSQVGAIRGACSACTPSVQRCTIATIATERCSDSARAERAARLGPTSSRCDRCRQNGLGATGEAAALIRHHTRLHPCIQTIVYSLRTTTAAAPIEKARRAEGVLPRREARGPRRVARSAEATRLGQKRQQDGVPLGRSHGAGDLDHASRCAAWESAAPRVICRCRLASIRGNQGRRGTFMRIVRDVMRRAEASARRTTTASLQTGRGLSDRSPTFTHTLRSSLWQRSDQPSREKHADSSVGDG